MWGWGSGSTSLHHCNAVQGLIFSRGSFVYKAATFAQHESWGLRRWRMAGSGFRVKGRVDYAKVCVCVCTRLHACVRLVAAARSRALLAWLCPRRRCTSSGTHCSVSGNFLWPCGLMFPRILSYEFLSFLRCCLDWYHLRYSTRGHGLRLTETCFYYLPDTEPCTLAQYTRQVSSVTVMSGSHLATERKD